MAHGSSDPDEAARDEPTAERDRAERDRAERARAQRARAEMVERQLRRRGIHDERVLAAMAEIPRESFVPAGSRSAAYDDSALPISEGQTISQPYMVARMTELLDVRPGDRILEIGTGSGYQAAVLAKLGARVTSIERFEGLARDARATLARLGIEGVEVRVGDGSDGDRGGAPWDGIVVTAGAPSIPEPLRDQLAVRARLVIPVGQRRLQELVIVERRSDTEWSEWSDGPVVFVPLVGHGGWADREIHGGERGRRDSRDGREGPDGRDGRDAGESGDARDTRVARDDGVRWI